jgi:hypothetical protein
MIAKINELKTKTSINEVKTLCETAISAISSAIYNGVTFDAQHEIERVALYNLFEGLNKYASNSYIKEWVDNQKRIYSVKNLGVRTAVNRLIENESRFDPTLSIVLENFRNKVEQNIPEVLLYEEFISALSGFNYLPAVNTELNAVASRVDQYKNDVDISKIIATMAETRSSYLLPVIEDVVENYLNKKTEQNKSSLKETLIKFSYDPFIRDILNIVTLDATQLQLEYNNAQCDIDDKLFSPILYLGENEALFNVRGSYYVKKGNNVHKIKNADVNKLDESFRALCDIINLPNVEISKKDIKVYIGNREAELTENKTIIDGQEFSAKQINESVKVAEWTGDVEFFKMINLLRENFDEIAELDFVKRVYLKENANHAADIFKLRDNIFITTFDPVNDKTTFYRNINPIQAEKIMMEHMRYDVSKTFEDILPNKEKILNEINETKQEYNNYISELRGKIDLFSTYGPEHFVASEVIKSLQEELTEVKEEYKKYLNEIESFTSVTENLNITVQDDQTGKSYTVVVPTGAMAAKGSGTQNEPGTDAEGDEFGTTVGKSSITDPVAGGPASTVTFDDDQTELLSDMPSSEEDKVDLDADELEAYADKVDAEAELEKPEMPKGEEEFGDEEGTTELELDNETEEEIPAEDEEDKKEETVGAPNKNLERTAFDKDKNPNDLNEPKKVKKVFLKRPKQTK